ncbi:MAG: tripartite tricarboxylate transporter permease, partial [Deltaproteobacteria bacterium]|nr:tripartite tricarboxylate transporter permease [Deltaproteobacteria bacterium]
MLESLLTALGVIFSPYHLLLLLLGVFLGILLGAVPGLGGIVGLTVVLPFVFQMSPSEAMVLLVGLVAVVTSSDSIPAVLFAVPGTAAAQATIMDGHPMAKKGEAGRAFGAIYSASMMGGVFGGIALLLAIPIMRPLVLSVGSPELFMLGLLGISMVGVLSGRAPLQGLVARRGRGGGGKVGVGDHTGLFCWAMGAPDNWEGLPLVPAVMGVFGIPEIVEMVIRRKSIADVPRHAIRGVLTGIGDTFRHWFLVLRCSVLGTWIGLIPGLGSDVVDWFAYGHTVQSSRPRENFGKGDVRGVIGPESAANAKLGGSLIPTIAFGIPGSLQMIILLGAFMILGLRPGPEMLTDQLDVTFTIVWSLVLANVFGTLILLPLTGQLAKLALVRIQVLAPVIISILFLASFLTTRDYGDLVVLIGFGLFAWVMKLAGWPRPPLVLGLVLGPVIGKYLFISTHAYNGFGWLARPGVILLFLAMVASVAFG